MSVAIQYVSLERQNGTIADNDLGTIRQVMINL